MCIRDRLWILASATGFGAPAGRTVGPTVGGALFVIFVGWLVTLDWVSDVEQSSVFETNLRRPALLDWIDAAILPLSLALQATYALRPAVPIGCLLYTSDAADERSSVDLGGRR